MNMQGEYLPSYPSPPRFPTNRSSYDRQIANRYGQDVAQEALHRSTSDLQLKEKGRAYSFNGYAPSITTSEGVQDPALLGVNTLPLR